jgi:hypothetical protein
LGLDLFSLGLYVGFENIMGVMLVPKPSKYKSIGVNVDTYEKIVQIANKERRNISQQLSLLVDEEYRSQGLQKTAPPVARAMVGGISAVIED